jgi:hypothetical protein
MADHLLAGLHCRQVSDLAAGFVLGALEPSEMMAVRAHVASCPEAHPEFEELGSVVPALLTSSEPVEPSSELRGRILAAAREDQAVRGSAAPEPMSVASTTTPVIVAPRDIRSAPSLAARLGLTGGSRRPAWAAAGLAAVLAIVVLGSWNLQLRSESDNFAAYRQGVAAVLDAAAQPGAQLAVLVASNESSSAAGLAAVRSDGTVAIAMAGLAPTAGSQVYEAWVIASSSKAVPIGSFAVGSSGSASLTVRAGSATPGVVVALTLEPGAGATNPTLPIIASGTAQAIPG